MTNIPPFHGAHVYLGVAKGNGSYAVRTDYEGPVAHWWKRAEEDLQPCWSNAHFTVDDGLLPLTLERDADEEPYRALERAD